MVINREPITITQLEDDIYTSWEQRNNSSIAFLFHLKQKLLIQSSREDKDTIFTLHPILMEYFAEKLIENFTEAITTNEFNSNLFEFCNRYSLIKATTKEYIREAQTELLLQPVVDRATERLSSQENLTKQIKNILSNLQQSSAPYSRYFVGNLINILSHIDNTLIDYDFSNLEIWQAYLQGVNLHNVNFTNSNFKRTVFTQTFGSITPVVFSPDRKYLAVGDSLGNVYLWDKTDGQLIWCRRGHAGWTGTVAFSPNGQMIASSGDDCAIKVWSVETGRCIGNFLEHTQGVWSVAFSPDSKKIASASEDCTVKIWDMKSSKSCITTQAPITLTKHGNGVQSVAFHPNGEMIVSGSRDGRVILWNFNAGSFDVLGEHADTVQSVTFSPDGKQVASGSEDHTVRVWNVETYEHILTIQEEEKYLIKSIDFSPDSKKIAFTANQIVKLWDIENEKAECIQTFVGHSNVIWGIDFSPDGKTIASCADRTVKIWDVKTGKCLNTFQGFTNWINEIAFSPDGQKLISGSYDQTVKIWEIESSQYITLPIQNSRVMSVAISPDNQIIASSEDKTIKLWKLETGGGVQHLCTLPGHPNVVRSITFSPDTDSKIIASSSEHPTIKLWNYETGECIRELPGHGNWVRFIAFSPDGQKLVSGSFDRKIKLWNIIDSDSQCLITFTGHKDVVLTVAYSPNGDIIASGSKDRTIKLWDVRTGNLLMSKEHSNNVESVGFSPNLHSQIVASADKDGMIKLWNIENRNCIGRWQGHSDVITSISFSTCGQKIATGSRDGTIKIWNIEGHCLHTLETRRPYEGIMIENITGITESQKASLKYLGANK